MTEKPWKPKPYQEELIKALESGEKLRIMLDTRRLRWNYDLIRKHGLDE